MLVNAALPITYTVFVLAIFGSVTVISLACLCITCAIIASTNVNRKAVYTRSGEAREGYKEDHKLNSAPEEAENEKEKKGAEDELCYATVIHPDNFARSIKFQQSTEYATVVINMSDTGVDTEDNIDDTGKDEEDLV
ncbi:hypothetical protein NFI96_032024 [Prochilodus magdalenae]|nr:hypothetical protein NFI96_032024 [Prochilodus magdalenae]